jgi:PPOX class probable F420-dependent enzyme
MQSSLTKEIKLAKLTEGQASFMHDEPNVGVVAVLREDGTAHQTVVWTDYDGEHVLLNLNTFRSKLEHLRRDPRVSLLVLDRNDPFRWLGLEGKVVEITPEGAYEHIVRQAGVYLGREEYPLKEGEQRILVRIELERVEAYKVE